MSYILEFEHDNTYAFPDRRWRCGVSQNDRAWLISMFGDRVRSHDRWDIGFGAWQYLGATAITTWGTDGRRGVERYKVRMRFRNKRDAMLFKLARR